MKKAIMRAMRLVAAMVVSVASLGVTSRSEAQGTFGMIPEPMSTVEVMRYADRLVLSNAQRQAVESLHDSYKEEFKALREGDIQDAMKKMSALEGNGGIPNRKSVEEWVKSMDDVKGKIERVDNKFFDGMQAILTPEQMGQMAKVKQQRERQRCSSGQFLRGFMEGVTDLTDEYLDLKLSPADSAASDEMMNQYEVTLTSNMRKLDSETSKMFLKIFDSLAAQGFDENSMTDPEKAQGMMEAAQRAFVEATKEIMKQAQEVGALNKRTFKGVYGVLPEKQARALRKSYFEKAYAEAGFATSEVVSSRVETAKKMDGVTAEEQTQLDEVGRDHTMAMDQLADSAVEEIDSFRKARNPMNWDNDSWQEHNKKMSELQKKGAEREQASMARMTEILGEERSQRLALDAAGKGVQVRAEVEAAAVQAKLAAQAGEGGDGEGMSEGAANEVTWGNDMFLPLAISERDVKMYVRRTGLTEDQAAIVAGIHEEYLTKWKELDGHEIKAVMEAVRMQWENDPTTGTTKWPTEQKIEGIYRVRKVAIEAIVKLDDSFFTDVETVVLSKGEEGRMKPARWMRARQTYNRIQNYGWFGGTSAEAKIDIYKLMAGMRPGKEELKAMDGELLKYEEQSATMYKEMYEAGMALQQQSDKLQGAIQKMQAEGSFDGMKYQEMMKSYLGPTQEALKVSNKKLIELNRRTVTAFAEGMTGDHGARFEMQYRKLAHPGVYNDTTSMEEAVMQSLRLESLNADQRQQLEALATEYRPAYAGKCEEMLTLADGMERGGMSTSPDDWKEIMAKQQQIQKLRFERGELSQRAMAKLQRILSEEQLKQIGPMPDAKAFEQGENQFYSDF